MHFDGPFYSPGLIGPDGKLARLHKGGETKQPKDPLPPPSKGVGATNILTAKERDPSRRMRGFSSTILTAGLNTGFGKSIIGG